VAAALTTNPSRSRPRSPRAARPLHRRVQSGQQVAHVVAQGLARRGGPHRAAGAVEQAYPQFLFQRLNLLAERRLRNMHAPGGPPEVQFFGHGQKVAQLAQLHYQYLLHINL